MAGDVPNDQITTFLLGLRDKGETVDELVGCAEALRSHAVPFVVPPGDVAHAVDTCGTGGDDQGTINASTIAALIVAASGVPVVKHGNRSASSRCGSADLLEALGIGVAVEPPRMLECFKRTNVAFLFAPTYHPAMKHVAAARKALGVRTIFNLVGPLANPAGIQRQVVGVSETAHVALLAQALQRLGAEHVAVVHGDDGLDEVTITTTTTVAEVRRGQAQPQVSVFDTEQTFGIRRASLEQLRGGDAATNARLAKLLLGSGADAELRPMQEWLLVNAAWGNYVSGMYPDNLVQCYDVARLALESGSALKKLGEVQRCLA